MSAWHTLTLTALGCQTTLIQKLTNNLGGGTLTHHDRYAYAVVNVIEIKCLICGHVFFVYLYFSRRHLWNRKFPWERDLKTCLFTRHESKILETRTYLYVPWRRHGITWCWPNLNVKPVSEFPEFVSSLARLVAVLCGPVKSEEWSQLTANLLELEDYEYPSWILGLWVDSMVTKQITNTNISLKKY